MLRTTFEVFQMAKRPVQYQPLAVELVVHHRVPSCRHHLLLLSLILVGETFQLHDLFTYLLSPELGQRHGWGLRGAYLLRLFLGPVRLRALLLLVLPQEESSGRPECWHRWLVWLNFGLSLLRGVHQVDHIRFVLLLQPMDDFASRVALAEEFQ